MHTARHLFEHCLSRDAPLIRGRTVILVTHHVSLCLPATAYLVELDRGRVLRQGTVEELRQKGHLAQVIEHEDIPGTSSAAVDAPTEDVIVNDADGGEPSPVAKTPATQIEAGKLVDAESRAEGRVSWRTYLLYIKSAGWVSWVLTVLLLVSVY